jgi:hypothetical protein
VRRIDKVAPPFRIKFDIRAISTVGDLLDLGNRTAHTTVNDGEEEQGGAPEIPR